MRLGDPRHHLRLLPAVRLKELCPYLLGLLSADAPDAAARVAVIDHEARRYISIVTLRVLKDPTST